MKKLRIKIKELSTNQMACKAVAMEMRKCLKYNTMPLINKQIEAASKTTSKIKTRFVVSGKLSKPKFAKNATLTSYVHQGISIWNKLPVALRSLDISDKSFKNKLLKWIASNDSELT